MFHCGRVGHSALNCLYKEFGEADVLQKLKETVKLQSPDTELGEWMVVAC